MRHHDDRAWLIINQAAQQVQNIFTGLAVQITGGFIGQQERRVIDQGAGDGDTLLLPAREFIGAMRGAIAQADGVQNLRGGLPGRTGSRPIDQ